MREIINLQQKLRDGGMGRRDFLTAMAALGVSAASAKALMLSSSALAATPQKGGTAIFANNLHGPDDQMDPIVFTSGIDYSRGRATYNGLTQLLDNMSLHPELAEEWSSNSNATEFTFKIRKGVEFHDGSPLTADDVVWSMNRHLGEDSPSSIKSFFATVKEWRKVDSHTVKVDLDSPDSDLPIKLGEKQAKIVKMGTKDFRKGNGTGPFRLESFEPGVRSVHSRNENYWREPANFDGLEITAITDPVARANALIAGDVHLIAQVDARSIAQIDEAEGVHINSTPSGLYGGICILKNTSPGESDDFVLGMQYIQDRERIVRAILKGHGQVGNDHPISPAYGADHCHELPQRTFDPDKAKFHLQKSGYTSAELYVAPVVAGIVETGLLMQANLRKIGFDLKVKKVTTDGYWGAVWMKEPMNVVTWNMRPTANAMLAIQFAPDSNWNDTFWHDEKFGQLLKDQLAQTDPGKRHQILCDMQGMVHGGSGMVIPYHVNILDGVSDRIHGVPNNPLGSLGGHEWPEFAWMSQ